MNLIGEVTLKRWDCPSFKNSCFLYDFKNLGITTKQFVDVIAGNDALVYERPLSRSISGKNCPWCDFKYKGASTGSLEAHIVSHGKNLVNYQVWSFIKDLHSLKLAMIREGYHNSIAFLVEHSCQFCTNPVMEGREGSCSIPFSARNKPRNLKKLRYPIGHITELREHEWSILGLIVLIET
jgi:hypothetical protein